MKSIKYVLLVTGFFVACGSQSPKQEQNAMDHPKVEFVSHDAQKKVDVMVGGKLFTSYRWHDAEVLDIKKPVLYPIITSTGTEVTRGYPLNPRAGERTDHPHHVGLCFNYGHVNGYDFWNNSSSIPESSREHYGTIEHLSIDEVSGGSGEGSMLVSESWVDPSGKELLAEKTEYHFISRGAVRFIDRITTLTATGSDVSMKDTKEGGFGIRVARQLELPSNDEVILTDAQGNPTTVKKMSNEGVSGNYRSSKGVSGEAVFATRGNWVNLYGTILDEEVSLVMVDHPDNPGYPTYWHARGYGLLLANPLGAGVYSKGEDVMNFSIPAGKSATFRFRLIVYAGGILADPEINTYANEFARKY